MGSDRTRNVPVLVHSAIHHGAINNGTRGKLLVLTHTAVRIFAGFVITVLYKQVQVHIIKPGGFLLVKQVDYIR